MPIISKVIKSIQSVVDWFSNLDDSQKEAILKIAAIVAAIGPALVIIGKVISVAGTLVSAIGMLFSPMGAVITIIAAVVAAGVALYKNWDTVKAKLSAFWQKWKSDWDAIKNFFSNVWSNMKDKATNTFNSIVDFVKKQVDKLKNLFDFKWELPKIELPHFFNSGNTGPLGLPKIEVEWYSKAMKNGMILDQPTILEHPMGNCWEQGKQVPR